MKHFSPLIPVLLLPVALSFAPAEERTSSHGGPVSFWSFDDSLKDEANDGKDDLAIRDGGKYTPRFVDASEVPGAIGKAVALGVKPGDAQYFTARTSADVKLGPDYTIEAWIQPTQFSQWNRLVLNWGKKHAYHLAPARDGHLLPLRGAGQVVAQVVLQLANTNSNHGAAPLWAHAYLFPTFRI